MKVEELKRIVENHFENESDRKRVICVIGTAVVGLSRVEIDINGATHWINQFRAEFNRNAEFAGKYQACLKEVLRSEILFPVV